MEHNYPVAGTPVNELDTPSLLIDVDAMERNLRKMADFSAASGVNVRPHIKTHKCTTLAKMQLQTGAQGLTCAKLGEAEVMAHAGIRDLLIANQIVGPIKIARLVELAKMSDVITAVDSLENAREISGFAEAEGLRVNLVIEVDTGMGRCGVPPGEPTLQLARQLVALPGVNFRGLLGYEGHAVFIRPREERKKVAEEASHMLVATADLLLKNSIEVEIVSAGGTGTYDITGRVPGITEIEPGSYLLMDGQYAGLDMDFELALSLLSQVISRPAPGHAIIDAGKKALTEEFGLPKVKGLKGVELVNLSEEHGSLALKDPSCSLSPGDKIEIIPSHGCTTINLHDEFYAIRDGRLIGVWPIEARGKIR